MKGDFIMETPKNEIQKIDKLISLLQEQISKPKESPISLFSINSAISALVPKVKSAVSEIKDRFSFCFRVSSCEETLF